MPNVATVPIQGVDYELITDSILRAAAMQAAVAQPDASIEIAHHYEHSQQHDPMIAMLLTVKVRNYRRLRYRYTLFGTHAFLAA